MAALPPASKTVSPQVIRRPVTHFWTVSPLGTPAYFGPLGKVVGNNSSLCVAGMADRCALKLFIEFFHPVHIALSRYLFNLLKHWR